MEEKYQDQLRSSGYIFKPHTNEDLHATSRSRDDLVKWHSQLIERKRSYQHQVAREIAL
jgi:hypothetical protein